MWRTLQFFMICKWEGMVRSSMHKIKVSLDNKSWKTQDKKCRKTAGNCKKGLWEIWIDYRGQNWQSPLATGQLDEEKWLLMFNLLITTLVASSPYPLKICRKFWDSAFTFPSYFTRSLQSVSLNTLRKPIG